MNPQERDELIRLNRAIIMNTEHAAFQFECWNQDRAGRLYQSVIAQLTKLINHLQLHQDALQEYGIDTDLQGFMQILSAVINAQQNQDSILLGDLLVLSVRPYLEQLLAQLLQITLPAQADIFTPENFLESNLALLERKNPELAQQIRTYVTSEQYAQDAGQYRIEPTASGYYTIKRVREDGEFYLNSNQNPRIALARWFASELRNDVEEYHLLGVGLGHAYHFLFSAVKNSFPIHFYETELYVLTKSLEYENLGGAIQEYIQIHYDPALKQLMRVMQDRRCQVLLYQPAIRNIAHPEVRAAIEKFYVAQSSAREMDLCLRGNFYMNRKAILQYRNIDRTESTAQASQNTEYHDIAYHDIEELAPAFQGREVYIIAAGPSLDKNLLQLKDRSSQSIVISTGTVYKKLLRNGIMPDYVIISEANRRVAGQVMLPPELVNEQTKQIPLIVLATTSPAICNAHPGPKYVALQYDFELTERMTEEEGRTLFMTGGSVSTTAFDVAVRLGARKIVFLGLDLAFTDGKAHASNSSNQNVPEEKDLSQTKGFYGDLVLTDHKFSLYRDWFRNRMKMQDIEGVVVINATEGGSWLEGMRHMSLTEAMQVPCDK